MGSGMFLCNETESLRLGLRLLFVCSRNIDVRDAVEFKIPSEDSQLLYICIKGDRFVKSAL